MAFWSTWFDGAKPPAASPRASLQDKGGGVIVTTPQQLEEALRSGALTASGMAVTADRAMRVVAVYACVRIRSGVVANMPIHIKRRIDDRTREDASDLPLWRILRRKPNGWQTAAQFKRMMQAHLLLRGNAYALIVRSRGTIQALIPLHPDRVEVKQNDDLSLAFTYTRADGRRIDLKQQEVLHLVGMTFDGVHGVSVIACARETIGLSLAMDGDTNTMDSGLMARRQTEAALARAGFSRHTRSEMLLEMGVGARDAARKSAARDAGINEAAIQRLIDTIKT